MPDIENVPSLADYIPSSKAYEISLRFVGEAGATIRSLMVTLNVDSPNEVAKRAIALLASAQGKEVLLRDPKTGATEAVEV